MPKLNVKVVHHPAQVIEDGQFTVKSVTTPQPTKYGSAIVLTVVGRDREERALFIPFSSEVTDQTNLGKLVGAFGDDPDQWIGKRINVTIGDHNQRTVEPVK
jgi:hypothetical protein